MKLLALYGLELEDTGRRARPKPSPQVRARAREAVQARQGARNVLPKPVTGAQAFATLAAASTRSFGRRGRPTKGDKYLHPPGTVRAPVIDGIVRMDLAQPMQAGGQSMADGIQRVREMREKK